LITAAKKNSLNGKTCWKTLQNVTTSASSVSTLTMIIAERKKAKGRLAVNDHVKVEGPLWQAMCRNCGWFGEAWGNPEQAQYEAFDHDCDKTPEAIWLYYYKEDN